MLRALPSTSWKAILTSELGSAIDLVPEPKSSVDVFVYSKSASSDQLIPIPRAHVSLQKTGADDPATTQDRITG